MTETPEDAQVQRIVDDIVTAQARRRRRTRWAMGASVAAVIAVAVPLAVALSRSAGDGHPIATGPTGTTTGGTATNRTESQDRHSDEAGIYAAVLGGRPQQRVVDKAKPVYVLDAFCTGMVDIEGGKRGPCTPGPISSVLQHDILAIVGGRMRFTDNPPQPSLQSPVVRIGTATVHADHATVAIDVECGPLCGEGQTMNVTRHGAVWRARPASGYTWIS